MDGYGHKERYEEQEDVKSVHLVIKVRGFLEVISQCVNFKDLTGSLPIIIAENENRIIDRIK